jgi:hypothetical protein
VTAVLCALAACGSSTHSQCPPVPNDTTQPAVLGVLPEVTSVLASGDAIRVHLSSDVAAIIERQGEVAAGNDGGVERTDWLGSAQGLVRFSGLLPGLAPWRGTAYVGGTTAVSSLPIGDDDDATRKVLQTGVGAAVVTDVDESHFRGFGVRVDLSHELDSDNAAAVPSATDGVDPFVSLRPLDVMRIGKDTYVQGMLELRYELMGCYAPFLHVSVGARKGSEDGEPFARFAVPMSLYVGAHREIGGDPVMLYGGIESHVLHPHDAVSFANRVRFGAETLEPLEDQNLRLGVAADFVLGEVNGAYASVTMSWGGP